MSERSVTHSTFVIERVYPASPERVFAAWSDAKAKSRWWVAAAEGITVRKPMTVDFRVGGEEHLAVETPDGTVFSYAGRFQDIVPNERIVETTQMHKGDDSISVSVVSVELTPDGDGTRLVLTEHGAYLDGLDKPEWREAGTRQQLDALAGEFAG